MVACTQDTSMPVCESDGGAAVVLLVVAVDGERRRRRLYGCCGRRDGIDLRARHVGMWYTDGSRVMLRAAAKATCAWRHTHDTRTPWSEDGCRGLLQHTRPVSRTSQADDPGLLRTY